MPAIIKISVTQKQRETLEEEILNYHINKMQEFYSKQTEINYAPQTQKPNKEIMRILVNLMAQVRDKKAIEEYRKQSQKTQEKECIEIIQTQEEEHKTQPQEPTKETSSTCIDISFEDDTIDISVE